MPEPVEAMSWGTIVKLAFTTGFFTAALNQGFSWIKETFQRRLKDRREGTAFALRQVESLTHYAQECISRLGDNENDDRRGEIGRHTTMPPLNKIADGPEWGLLKPCVAASIRDFYNEVEQGKRSIVATHNDLGPFEEVDTTNTMYILAGGRALLLCDMLRRRYGLGKYVEIGSFGFDNDIRKRYKKLNPCLVIRLWRSLFVHRICSRIRRLYCQLRSLVWRRMGRSSDDTTE